MKYLPIGLPSADNTCEAVAFLNLRSSDLLCSGPEGPQYACVPGPGAMTAEKRNTKNILRVLSVILVQVCSLNAQ